MSFDLEALLEETAIVRLVPGSEAATMKNPAVFEIAVRQGAPAHVLAALFNLYYSLTTTQAASGETLYIASEYKTAAAGIATNEFELVNTMIKELGQPVSWRDHDATYDWQYTIQLIEDAGLVEVLSGSLPQRNCDHLFIEIARASYAEDGGLEFNALYSGQLRQANYMSTDFAFDDVRASMGYGAWGV